MADLRQTNADTEFPRGGAVDDPDLEGDAHFGGTRTRSDQMAAPDDRQGPKTRRKNKDIVSGRAHGGTH